ncbi:hypothetical protein J7E99_35365 [Streptomyces sp. ISL-44]|uniref:hypothetical protein n=1 Tax=Streptomyces sp. ISL-44 TaxID=2819184 RepID=UPI001BEB5B2C|nr:hypothetical protein [Streptomyces sp. ISL-44]MBT2545812.1 hypothetical protein [Streptomyces sp. ISL-44]
MNVRDVARRLPDIATLRNLCRSMATLDAILQPGAPYLRHHRFDAHWSATQELASVDNGGGDAYSVVFSAAGAYIRGFDHESPMSPYAGDGTPWPGVVDTVPEVFRSCVEEPAFQLEGIAHITVCLWRENTDGQWRTGEVDFEGGRLVPDGSDWLFRRLVDGTPEKYQAWAQRYYRTPVDLDAVIDVYELRPLTPELVLALNPAVTLEQLGDTIASIGYRA